jgi:hypothetical protein
VDCQSVEFEEVVKQRFVSSITSSVRKGAALVSGTLDVVVSKMAHLEATNALAGGTGELMLRAKTLGKAVEAVLFVR